MLYISVLIWKENGESSEVDAKQTTFLIFVLPPQGRGSGFPGRRRPRGAGLSGRAGRGRARGKNGVSPSINPGVCIVDILTSLTKIGLYTKKCWIFLPADNLADVL